MTKDRDLRLKLTGESLRVLSELAQSADRTLQAYVERLILAHINSRLEEARRLVAAAEELPTSTATRDARLYFIQRGGSLGPVKIGISASIERRMKSLRTGSDELLTVLHECEQAGEITERALHRRFRADRMEGEWFKATPELLALIAGLTKLRAVA